MADEREGAAGPQHDPSDKNRIQSAGRQENAARPLNAAPDDGEPERYPAVDQSDAVQPGEARSFDPAADAPTPRQGAGDASPSPAAQSGRLGPQGDPVEGKRRS